jgi:hypothetical protein
MKKIKIIAGIELSTLLLSMFAFAFILYSINPVSADGVRLSEPTACCEKTKDGAYCVNTDEKNCAPGFQVSQTSCQTTSYCRLGTCYDSKEGICMSNTPQNLCVAKGGTWDPRSVNEVPQCQPGCCIIADQAAFVSLVRCKRLSSFFGVENNFRKDVTSELQCIVMAQSQDMGACVYEKEFERVCKFTTRADCGAPETTELPGSMISTEKRFYKDYLCSAEELNTICARQTSTTCFDGKVYWADSCGNRENIYSTNRDRSWNRGRVASPDEICSPNDGSNKDCGNCNYLLGSRCAEWTSAIGKPAGGNHYCQKTECVDRFGKKRLNGESWCVYDGEVGEGIDTVGSRHFREICIDGRVRVEPCADFRNEVCLQGAIRTDRGDYSTSACRVNRWQDCVLQDEPTACLNIDRRDCLWLPPVTGMLIGQMKDTAGARTGFSNPTAGDTVFTNPTAPTGRVIAPITGNPIAWGGSDEELEKTTTTNPEGICVPNFPPGLRFWESSAQQMCSMASAKCVVVYEKGLLDGSWKCVKNCECEDEKWAMEANRVCTSLGDCGGYVNYVGKYTDDGYQWKFDGKKQVFTPNNRNIISRGFTGMVVAMIGGVLMTGKIITGNAAYTIIQTKGESAIAGLKGGQIGTRISLNEGVAQKLSSALKTELGTTGDLNVIYNPASNQYTFSGGTLNNPVTLTGEAGTNALNSIGYELKANPGSKLSEIFGQGGGTGADALLTGLQWAAIAYGVGYLIGSLFGMSKQNTQALSTSLAAAAGLYKFAQTSNWITQNAAWVANPLVAIGLGAVIFIVMYKKTDTKTITFDCLPYQAPVGGNDCEKCNVGGLPCSEYRCKSLGQNCELVNPSTGKEMCVNINPRDVSPPVITPNLNVLTQGHRYTNIRPSPPSPGFNIINTNASDGCIKAFTPITFGITLNEPAQCKIDINQTTRFEDMTAFMGGSNLFQYNHTEFFALPGAKAFENSTFRLQNGKDMTFFIRCKDKNGNENHAEHAVSFCIDPSPDTTAPQIKATSVMDEGCIAENNDVADVEFYVNEPANCRWDFVDTTYDLMKNNMVCLNEMYQVNANFLFTCRARLSGIARDGTKYYVRCEDQPDKEAKDRNQNKESFLFNLRGSTALKINKIEPSSSIFGAVNPAPVELYVQTLFGCDNGRSICYYSRTDNKNDYVMFFDTNNEDGVSTQRQDLTAGQHTYHIQCIDAGGNLAKETVTFNLDIDTSAPSIARIYEEDKMLKIITTRKGECAYTFNNCDFTFEEGTKMPYGDSTVHVAEWNKDRTYYIKCRDEFKNEDATCSAIVKPTHNFL